MQNETRNCQNCKKDFMIESEDFNFFQKIKVPPPTFCPECRHQRRLCFRNERIFYKRNCDLCKQNIISIYPKDVIFPVYCQKCWWSDNWNPCEHTKEFDFTKPFIFQWITLFNIVPKIASNNSQSVRSEYSNFATQNKECYLVVSALENENTLYSTRVYKDKDIVDCYNVFDSNLVYGSIDSRKCYFLINSQECEGCTDSIFLFDCRNSNNCIACVGLRNQSLKFLNESINKNVFKKILNKILNDKNFRNEIQNKFKKLKLQYPHKFGRVLQSTNSIGNNLVNCKNCNLCFEINTGEDCNFFTIGGKVKSEMDVTYDDESFLMYEVMSGQTDNNCVFSSIIWFSNNLSYCDFCMSSSNLFGCVGLRNKNYCILNKQYTKEEYEELVPKIIQHMNDIPYIDEKGRIYKYGEFFPSELSPFCYNETIAQEYFPLTKEQALEQGYKWKDREERNYSIEIKNEDIPDIYDASIIGKVIECANNSDARRGRSPDQDASRCTEAFKIIPQEFQFYQRMNLPLPRLCPNCRHYQRLKQRNPLKIWHRQCMCNKENHEHKGHCKVEFETSYAPDRSEIIYCESCYQQEVY